MRIRLLLLISVALNVLFFAALLARPNTSSSGEPHANVPSLGWTNDMGGTADADRNSNSPLEHLADREYGDLVSRLRQIGLPETMVQDVVVGAINRRYGPRIVALRANPWRFWEPIQRRTSDETQGDLEREQQARALERERSALAQQFLQVDWTTIESHVTGRPDPFARFTDQYPAEKRAQTRAVLAAYDELERDVIQSAGGTVGLPERAELNRIFEEKLGALRQLLSPTEVDDYEVRASPLAEQLKQTVLIGFEPSEEEFRTIHRIWKAFEDHPPASAQDEESPSAQRRLWEGDYQKEMQLKEALGEERYADYLRSQDYTFRSLIELTGQFDLPARAAADVHRLREAALQTLREISADPAHGLEQRVNELHQLRNRTESAVRQVLGESAYQRYAVTPMGGWIGQIDQQ